MTRDEARRIIKSERLGNISWFSEDGRSPEKICISNDGGRLAVYTLDAFMRKFAERFYESEDTAFEDLIVRARADRELFLLWK